MWDENLRQEVMDAVEGAGESSAQEPSENVPSNDVKETETIQAEQKAEEPKAKVEEPVKEVSKSDEQIQNLNKALQEERERAKELKAKIEEMEWPLNKLKWVFAPPKQEEKDEVTPNFLTKEQLEEYLESKDSERREQEEKLKKAEMIENEVNTLEKEWDWKDWKPKYDDQEVINWQRDNGKLYLSPSEAFFAMKKDALLDYEVKKRLSWKPDSRELDQPSWTEAKEEIKKDISEDDIRGAVLEAIESEMTQDIN